MIAPIGREGTPEHAHFRALYDEILIPILKPFGYDLVRADDVQRAGAITKDIVLHLAKAALVVADLTDLNPNVFYELGVRHSLRGQGTIMIVDDLRTDYIPFDLQAYRVVKFKGELPGFGKLRQELTAFITSLNRADLSRRDNPVHDWIPSLPIDAMESSLRSDAGELRVRISELEQQLDEYERAYGIVKSGRTTEAEPLDIIIGALDEAKEGILPSDLLTGAEEAMRKRDKKEFLLILKRIMEDRAFRYSPRNFRTLAADANVLGLREIAGAILDHAVSLFPKDEELRESQLALFAHSTDPNDRERARKELLNEIGITVDNGEIQLPDYLTDEKAQLIGIMLDAFHADKLHDQALSITRGLVERFSDLTLIARNHARSLENVQRGDEALEWYQRSIWCEDVSDTSANWFGNELHNRGRPVDAAEVYLLACLYDPNDGEGFSHVADDIIVAMTQSKRRSGRHDLPKEVGLETVAMALTCALACPLTTQETLSRCGSVANRMSLDTSTLDITKFGTMTERLEFASGLYELFKSEITQRAVSAGSGPLAMSDSNASA